MDMARAKKVKVTLESLGAKIGSKFDTLDAKVDSTFSTLDEKIDLVIDAMVTHEDLRQLEERLDRKLDERIAEVIEAIDNLTTQFGKLNIEYAAISAKLARYEKWFEILAKKTGVKLPL